MTPMKCPRCPERNYYGRLVDLAHEPNPKCDNCKSALVITDAYQDRIDAQESVS